MASDLSCDAWEKSERRRGMDASSAPSWNERIRQERIRRNLRQQDLADQLGTTALTIRRWERGIQQPGPYFRMKLCSLFEKSAEELGLVTVNASLPTTTEDDGSKATQAPSSLAEAPGIWTVPYLRNPHFTGRDDLLERLAQQLSCQKQEAATTRQAVLSQPQAIKGLGGIGKTQIAVEYAFRAQEQGRYTHTFWINAASEEAILTSFQMLAERLPDFTARDEKDQHKLITAILRWLEACPQPWLLIFDSADEPALIQPYLPQLGQGSILLTTRAHAISWLAAPLEVEQMGLVEGTRLLLHRALRLQATDEECNEATNIVIALDGFPLALDQAGAYIEETGCSFSDYFQLYEQHRATLLARRGRQATNYPASVVTTWEISFQKIAQSQPAAAELLRLCAFLFPDYIPEELLTQGAPYWPPLLQEAVTDLLRFNELLEALLAFSLIKRQTQERLLSLHRLVQAVQQDQMNLEEQRQWAERVVRATTAVFPEEVKATTWQLCQRYLAQAQECTLFIQNYTFTFAEAASLLFRTANYLYDHALYEQAESLYLQALAIREQILGFDHTDVAVLLHRLARLYSQKGMYDRAEPLLQRALRIQEQALGPDHPDVAASLYSLATCYSRREKGERAESFFQRALSIWEQTLGPTHPNLAGPLDALGILYARKKRYERAESFFQRALSIREQILGSDHPDVAASLNNLANFYLEMEKYEQAEPSFQRALSIWERTLGPGHHYLAYPLSGLATLYVQQRKCEQAEPLYLRALSIWEHIQEQHPDADETLEGLAALREAQGNLREAASFYQRSLAIREQVLGTQHPKTVECRKRLCGILHALGKAEEAAALEVQLDVAISQDEQRTL
jgi:tetratricopeptide (TPR) repeat protein/transcriptional regulator with XRE-family HTH domain